MAHAQSGQVIYHQFRREPEVRARTTTQPVPPGPGPDWLPEELSLTFAFLIATVLVLLLVTLASLHLPPIGGDGRSACATSSCSGRAVEERMAAAYGTTQVRPVS